MPYEIERGIPIPPSKQARPAIYPVKALAVGDSFLIPAKAGEAPAKLYSRVSNMLVYYKRKLGRTYTQRAVEGGVRVWRTG